MNLRQQIETLKIHGFYCSLDDENYEYGYVDYEKPEDLTKHTDLRRRVTLDIEDQKFYACFDLMSDFGGQVWESGEIARSENLIEVLTDLEREIEKYLPELVRKAKEENI